MKALTTIVAAIFLMSLSACTSEEEEVEFEEYAAAFDTTADSMVHDAEEHAEQMGDITDMDHALEGCDAYEASASDNLHRLEEVLEGMSGCRGSADAGPMTNTLAESLASLRLRVDGHHERMLALDSLEDMAREADEHHDEIAEAMGAMNGHLERARQDHMGYMCPAMDGHDDGADDGHDDGADDHDDGADDGHDDGADDGHDD